MFDLKKLTRYAVFVGAALGLLGPSAFAQYGSYPRTYQRAEWGYANRVVRGTVVAVSNVRYGQRIRLADGMELVVPESALSSMHGRRGAAALVPGDVVRMTVHSVQGDGRDARVLSIELLQSNSYYGNSRRTAGTIVSVNRRDRFMVLETDGGYRINVDLRVYAGRDWSVLDRFQRGDRVSITGRMERGTIIAEEIRSVGDHDRWDHR
ncbi:MAG: hypothetical protein QOK37_4217 [Thermoanaerobaculia bacterium]|nr:hypothetical protein [Thermoanaerobaculia bacterium]